MYEFHHRSWGLLQQSRQQVKDILPTNGENHGKSSAVKW
jgi:hypothetical protein